MTSMVEAIIHTVVYKSGRGGTRGISYIHTVDVARFFLFLFFYPHETNMPFSFVLDI